MASSPIVLQKYNILEKLAAGGMAEIYLASRKEAHFQNKFFAIKRVLPSLTEKAEYLVYLKDEAKVLSLLQHQNIIGFEDFFYENEEFYLVMEYVSGKTLREFFNDLEKANQALSIEYILYLITEVAAGLDYAHRSQDFVLGKSLNLVHRDLNPQNIMISFEGQVKIIDFGITKFDVRDDFTKTGMLKGKFGYMSPEQVEGAEIDARTDVFALGILCWELLTNKRLFDGADDFEKYNKIKNHQLASICEINSLFSKDLDKIVMKALAPKANDRYQSASELRHDLILYIAKNFPEFRPEHFRGLIGQLYASDFRRAIEKLRDHFQKGPELQVEEGTATSREYFAKQAEQERIEALKRAERSQHGVNLNVPESFEQNLNKARLNRDVPIHKSEKIEKPIPNFEPEKKKVKRPRHTQQEPERYKVQVKNIQTSFFASFMNGPGGTVFRRAIWLSTMVCLGWVLAQAYELGYAQPALDQIQHLAKHFQTASAFLQSFSF